MSADVYNEWPRAEWETLPFCVNEGPVVGFLPWLEGQWGRAKSVNRSDVSLAAYVDGASCFYLRTLPGEIARFDCLNN